MGDDDPTPVPAPKPTRAGMEELQRRYDDAMSALLDTGSQLREITAERDAWREAKAPDREAEAIAGCVRAIEGMFDPRNVVAGSSYMGESQRRPPGVPYTPPAADTPVGRVLLHLAARYGVPLVDAPRSESAEEYRTVSLPVRLADRLEHL